MRKIIDSHFHLLALEKKNISAIEILDQMETKNWGGGIDVGLSGDDLPMRLHLLSSYPKVKTATGLGPWASQQEKPIKEIVDTFIENVKNLPFDFVGEIGLDYYHNYSKAERQIELFMRQIDFANTINKPIIVHNRNSDDDMIQTLNSKKLNKDSIMHCFSSDEKLLNCALNNNFYISFAGPITYKNNDQLRKMVLATPLDRLLLETDAPYLAPVPLRGKINTPLNMVYVYKEAAKIKNIPFETLVEAVYENFKRVCSLS
jgi:TatD DNase family protein